MIQFFLLVLLAFSYSEYTCKNDITKCPAVDKDKKLLVTSTTSGGLCNCKYEDAEISFGVTTVESNLLYGAKVKTVLLSDVSTINSGAFAHTKITTVDFSDAGSSLTINDGAFYYSEIDELIFPSYVNIPSSALAFQNSNIKELDLSSIISFNTNNGKDVFYYATIGEISKVNKNSESVGSGLFGNSRITTLNFNGFKNIKEIGQKAFEHAVITKIESFGSITYIGANAFQYAIINEMKSFGSIKKVDSYAFYYSTVKSINFGTSILEKILQNAFDHATLTPTVQTFPETLDKIGQEAFIESKLTSVTFSSKNNDLSIDDSAFKDLKTLLDATIHAKTISQDAFSGCINLKAKSISIAASGNINQNAFLNCYNLSCGLTIAKPSSSKSNIYASAFENSGITSINLPNMNQIANNAFKNCTRLAEGGVLNCETISDSAFEGDDQLVLTSITSYSISQYAFKDCRKLGASITINIRYNSNAPLCVIGFSAFEHCDELKNLTFLGNQDFDDPTINKESIIPYTFSIGQKAFYRSGLQGSLVLPYTLTIVDSYAFAYCSKLTSLTIDGVYHLKKHIKDHAFYRSSIAGPLYLPNTVHEVQSEAFAFCPITELTIFGSNAETYNEIRVCSEYDQTDCWYVKDEDNCWIGTKISDNAFYECRKLTKLSLEGNDIIFVTTSFLECPIIDLSITADIKNIPVGAFYGMKTITSSIEMPDSVETIGTSAFEGCSKLNSVTFGQNSKLNNIGTRAFYGCSELRTTNIPNEVEDLNGYTYYGCSKLSSITLPPYLKTIKNYEFYDCGELNCKLIIPDELKSIGTKAFYRCSKLNGPLEFQDSTETIGEKAFYGCYGFSPDLTFGRKIKTIDVEAFRGCTSLTGKLKFPDYIYNDVGGVLTIKKRAFYECRFTNTLELPQKVKFSGEEAFRGCSGFTGELVIPEGATFDNTAKYTFRDCTGFSSLKIKDLTAINEGTFQNCTGLASEIPLENIQTIGQNAFSGCSKLTGPLHLSSSTVEDYAFYNCAGLNGDLICDSPLSKVGKYAFYGCSGLTGQLDCTSMQSVGRYAFYECSGLTGPINFTTSLQTINEYAFAGCTGFSNSLTFKVNELTLRYGAFKGCTGLQDGTLRFIIDSGREEDNQGRFYSYPYFLSIDTDAFEDVKFKDIYYLGRFAPDCGYDSGLSKVKKIYTSANFANKTFCGKTVKGKGGLSGGAIAGIVIACVVVVALIVFLVIFFLKKKGNDNSENEVEMNNEP